MKAIPPSEFPLPPADGATDASAEAAAHRCALQWLALHRAAAAVATLASVDGEVLSARLSAFPETVTRAGGWRLGLARQGIADIAAFMEPGLTALIAVHAAGSDPAPAARALLQEFTAARDALLGLAQTD